MQIVTPTDPQFRYITCDSPVVLESVSDRDIVGFGSDDAIVLFPLTPRCLIVFSGNQGRIGTASAQSAQVVRVNELLALSAERYVIAPDEAMLGSLVGHLRLGKTKRGAKYITGRIMTSDGAIGVVKRTFPHRTPPLSLDSEADAE